MFALAALRAVNDTIWIENLLVVLSLSLDARTSKVRFTLCWAA